MALQQVSNYKSSAVGGEIYRARLQCDGRPLLRQMLGVPEQTIMIMNHDSVIEPDEPRINAKKRALLLPKTDRETFQNLSISERIIDF